jgi:hypothetical protein
MACREFTLWYNPISRAFCVADAMACREFTLWYNTEPNHFFGFFAMACREFTLWYNTSFTGTQEVSLWLVGNSRYDTIKEDLEVLKFRLWLVGNSRYDTMSGVNTAKEALLWLVGNSRYDTIWAVRAKAASSYGLSGIHAMIQSGLANDFARLGYGLSGIHAMIQWAVCGWTGTLAMACREFTLWYNRKCPTGAQTSLWLVGNSRYDTIVQWAFTFFFRYGLSGIHAMIQSHWPNPDIVYSYGLSGIHAMIQSAAFRDHADCAMACREFTLWYNNPTLFFFAKNAMACREFTLWYNNPTLFFFAKNAMACREFTLWYNYGVKPLFWFLLWLVGNSRYDTI